ncbi:uncharacterized protein LOC111133220 isoform X5 [Crassostrea virginica]
MAVHLILTLHQLFITTQVVFQSEMDVFLPNRYVKVQLRGIQKGEMEVILSGFLHFLEHLSYVQYSSFQLSSTEGKKATTDNKLMMKKIQKHTSCCCTQTRKTTLLEATADNKLMMKKIKKLTSCCRTQTRKTTGLSRVMKNRFFTNGKKTTFFLFQQKQLMK